jgi:hypothetical protein
MTVTAEGHAPNKPLYIIQATVDRGRAVYASKVIPSGTTIHVASSPFVSVIKEGFKKEVCAWCFKYEHGKKCQISHQDTRTGVWFCSPECRHQWNYKDYSGDLAKALISLRTDRARKVLNPMLVLTSIASFKEQ